MPSQIKATPNLHPYKLRQSRQYWKAGISWERLKPAQARPQALLCRCYRLQPEANTSASPAKHPIRALILVPTRELAIQVYESVKTYGKYLPLRCAAVYGGMDIDPQIRELRAGVEILVATPGRLLDHIQQKTMNLSKVEILVLDEADRMLDMGFLPDIKRILGVNATSSVRVCCSQRLFPKKSRNSQTSF